jgi:hypothetical protein
MHHGRTGMHMRGSARPHDEPHRPAPPLWAAPAAAAGECPRFCPRRSSCTTCAPRCCAGGPRRR